MAQEGALNNGMNIEFDQDVIQTIYKKIVRGEALQSLVHIVMIIKSKNGRMKQDIDQQDRGRDVEQEDEEDELKENEIDEDDSLEIILNLVTDVASRLLSEGREIGESNGLPPNFIYESTFILSFAEEHGLEIDERDVYH